MGERPYGLVVFGGRVLKKRSSRKENAGLDRWLPSVEDILVTLRGKPSYGAWWVSF